MPAKTPKRKPRVKPKVLPIGKLVACEEVYRRFHLGTSREYRAQWKRSRLTRIMNALADALLERMFQGLPAKLPSGFGSMELRRHYSNPVNNSVTAKAKAEGKLKPGQVILRPSPDGALHPYWYINKVRIKGANRYQFFLSAPVFMRALQRIRDGDGGLFSAKNQRARLTYRKRNYRPQTHLPANYLSSLAATGICKSPH